MLALLTAALMAITSAAYAGGSVSDSRGQGHNACCLSGGTTWKQQFAWRQYYAIRAYSRLRELRLRGQNFAVQTGYSSGRWSWDANGGQGGFVD